MKNKTLLIFRHELLKTVRRTGFIILTLALPVLALLAIAIFQAVSGAAKPPAEATRVGYVDQMGGLDQFTAQGNLELLKFDSPEAARAAFARDEIKQYFVVPSDFIASGTLEIFLPQEEIAPSPQLTAAIENFTSANLLNGKVPPEVIARLASPPRLITTTLTPAGDVAPRQTSYLNFIVPGLFSFLLALSLIFTSTYVLQSLSEEKENRLMEILMSSVSPRQLLAGKVLGLGTAGLLQVVVWVISLPLLLRLASSSIGGFLSDIQVPANFWVLGVIYFVLGYLFFAVVAASIAALSSSVQEAQGIAGIYTLFNVAPFWFVSLLLLYPSNPAWIVFSIFPLSAPVLTMMRLGLIGVPAWQMAVSIIVLVLSVAGGLFIAARLLRAYMLLYGKRPNLATIVRNINRV